MMDIFCNAEIANAVINTGNAGARSFGDIESSATVSDQQSWKY